MEDIRIQIPYLTMEQKKILIKALNYYRLSGVEFSYSSDDIIFNATNLMEIIDFQSKIIKIKE